MHIREIAREAFEPLGAGASSKRYLLAGLLGLLLMLLLTAVNQWLGRRWFGRSYLRFYLNYGYLVSLGLTALTLLVDLDKNVDLISSHPFRYVYACLNLIKVPLQIVLRRDSAQDVPSATGPTDSALWNPLLQFARALMNILDQFFSGFFCIIFILILLVWLWLIAPLQYFIYLICGAPARVIGRSTKTMRPAASAPERRESFASADDDSSAESLTPETDYFNRPVRITTALATAVLWGLSKLF
jgi:hypothetical protein